MDATYISNRIKCSETEKFRAFQTVKKLANYSQIAIEKGLLSLEPLLEDENDRFLKDCLTCLLDTREQNWLREYILIRIMAANVTGERFLEMAVIADATLHFPQDYSVRTLFIRLSAWFGEDFQHYFDEELELFDKRVKQKKQQEREKRQKELTVSAYPEFDILPQYGDAGVTRILREIDNHTLALAMKWISYSVYEIFMRNLSKERIKVIMEEGEYMRNIRVCYLKEYQKRILEIVKRLDDEGEIALTD